MVDVNLNQKLWVVIPYNLDYLTDNGLLQKVIGTIDEGYGKIQEMQFFCYLPYDTEGAIILRQIPSEFAMPINGNLVCDCILNKYKNDESFSVDIENISINELLSMLDIIEEVEVPISIINGIVAQTGKQKQIKNDYRYEPPQNQISVIDITETANPRKEQKDG